MLNQPGDLLRRYQAHWQLRADHAPFYTASSVLQPVRWQGQPAMLKIALDPDEARGQQAMAWHDGRGTARVWRQHGLALLMERLLPGPALPVMAIHGQDEECAHILCRTAAALHGPGPDPQPVLVPLSQWFQDLLRLAVGAELPLQRAAALAAALLTQQREVVVLHGDLHHGNVMPNAAGQWCAIDAKGLWGDRAFDYANLFCNPGLAQVSQPGRFERLLTLVSAAASLSPTRLLQWIIAWAGLAVCWHRQDGTDHRPASWVLQHALAQWAPGVS